MNHPYLSQQELVSFVPLPSWIRAAVRCGFPIAPVLYELDIPLVESGPQGIVITQQQSWQLMEACVTRARGEHFPFVLGETAALESIPEAQAYLCSCTTLREALQYYNWVGEVMGNGVHLSLPSVGTQTLLRICIGSAARRSAAQIYFTETILASILRLIDQLLGHRNITELRLRHARPDYAAAYASLCDAPLLFEQAEDGVLLPSALLDLPLPGAVPELQQQARARLLQRLASQVAQASVVQQLNRLFEHDADLLLAGLEQAAERLNIQPRTLQRRLQEAKQTFSDVQSQARFHMTCALLRNTRCSVDEISERLGFSDRRALTRAFKRWSNISPSHYRSRCC